VCVCCWATRHCQLYKNIQYCTKMLLWQIYISGNDRTFAFMSLNSDKSVTTQNLCFFFQEKVLKALKCYNFLWVQQRHNCSPAASYAYCFMTLYLLKVHLQTFLSVPITQRCQILSCDTLVPNERCNDPDVALRQKNVLLLVAVFRRAMIITDKWLRNLSVFVIALKLYEIRRN